MRIDRSSSELHTIIVFTFDAGLFRQQAGEAPLQYLRHCRRIVRRCAVGARSDVERAVVRLTRGTIFKYHHRSNLLLAGCVGNVVALDTQRCCFQAEVLSQFFERPGPLGEVTGTFRAVKNQRLLCVFLHRFHQGSRGSALRHTHTHTRTAQRGEPLLQGVAIRRLH